MTVTDEINEFIAQNGGNARDALNVALVRLKVANERIEQLEEDVEEYQRREVFEVCVDGWGDEGGLKIGNHISHAGL